MPEPIEKDMVLMLYCRSVITILPNGDACIIDIKTKTTAIATYEHKKAMLSQRLSLIHI